MPSQAWIDHFTLAFHQEALQRLARDSSLQTRAIATLDRWERQGAADNSNSYRTQWRHLLSQDVADWRTAVLANTEHAATLRNCSPLGFVLTQEERMKLRGSLALAPSQQAGENA